MKGTTISLAILLSAFWLLNSGHYNPLMLFFGAFSVALVLILTLRMNVVDAEAQPLHLVRIIPAYYLWLLKELVLSNVEVVQSIWRGKSSISPAMATLKCNLKTDIGRVIYANSITLTPGTVTLDIDDNSVTVHALLAKSIDVLRTGEMEARVSRLEK